MSAQRVRMSFVQNVMFRLIGLFIFFAPRRGAEFMASVVVGTNERLAEIERNRHSDLKACSFFRIHSRHEWGDGDGRHVCPGIKA